MQTGLELFKEWFPSMTEVIFNGLTSKVRFNADPAVLSDKIEELLAEEKKYQKALAKEALGLLADKIFYQKQMNDWKKGYYKLKKEIKHLKKLEDGLTIAYMSGFYDGKKSFVAAEPCSAKDKKCQN